SGLLRVHSSPGSPHPVNPVVPLLVIHLRGYNAADNRSAGDRLPQTFGTQRDTVNELVEQHRAVETLKIRIELRLRVRRCPGKPDGFHEAGPWHIEAVQKFVPETKRKISHLTNDQRVAGMELEHPGYAAGLR